MKHYMVVSPEIKHDYYPEPPEYGCCVVFVQAHTQREAKILAVKHKDMKDWVDEQRGNLQNPFSGLKVQECLCPHGKCWCEDCVPKYGECEECLAEADAKFRMEVK